jgi:hypothetical protein
MRLFITGFLQIFFVSINTYLIAKTLFLGIFVCAFMISFIWSFNVKKVAFGTLKDRLLYSFGAGLGSIIGTVLISEIC